MCHKCKETYRRKDIVPDMFPKVAERRPRRDNIPRNRCRVVMFSIRRGQIPGCSWNCASVP